MMAPYAGYWGKLPAHGDFLRAGFPDAVVQRLDHWISTQLQKSRKRHGAAFERLWHAAPGWHFTLRPGTLDPACAVTGLWTPSIDSVGRCFPFIFGILHDPAVALFRALPPFEAAITQAIAESQTVTVLNDAVMAAGQLPLPAAAAVQDVWWCAKDITTDPAGHACPGRTIHGALPIDDAFDWLLDAPPPTEPTRESGGAKD